MSEPIQLRMMRRSNRIDTTPPLRRSKLHPRSRQAAGRSPSLPARFFSASEGAKERFQSAEATKKRRLLPREREEDKERRRVVRRRSQSPKKEETLEAAASEPKTKEEGAEEEPASSESEESQTTTPSSALEPPEGAGKGKGPAGEGKGAGKGGPPSGKGARKGGPPVPPPPSKGAKKALLEKRKKDPLSCTQLECFNGIYKHSGTRAALEGARGMRGYISEDDSPEAVSRETGTLGQLCETVVAESAEVLRALALRTLDFDPSSVASWEDALRRLVGPVSDIRMAVAREQVGSMVEQREPDKLVEAIRAGSGGQTPLKRDIEESLPLLAPALVRLSHRAPVVQATRLPSPDVNLSGPEMDYVYRFVKGSRIPTAADISKVLRAAFAERSTGCVGRYIQGLARAKAPNVFKRIGKKTAIELEAEAALQRLVGEGEVVPETAQQVLVPALKKLRSLDSLGGALGGLGRLFVGCAKRSQNHGDSAFRRELEMLGAILERARGTEPHDHLEALTLWSNVLGAAAELGQKALFPQEHSALALRSADRLRQAEASAQSAVAVSRRLVDGTAPAVSKADLADSARFLRVLQDVYDKAVGPGVLGVCGGR